MDRHAWSKETVARFRAAFCDLDEAALGRGNLFGEGD